ncbi:MAG TPA: hypothetical protein VLE97_06250 [Gaiellaceae bacterium]|nr:hypothetical protein [Gaiellaceae bacterium]
MGKRKSTMVLGYTRSGHEVCLPTRQNPDMAQFITWTPGDHLDASRILTEHGEREEEPIGSWCMQWAGSHWAIGKSAKKRAKRARRTGIRGAAEIVILTPRRR